MGVRNHGRIHIEALCIHIAEVKPGGRLDNDLEKDYSPGNLDVRI